MKKKTTFFRANLIFPISGIWKNYRPLYLVSVCLFDLPSYNFFIGFHLVFLSFPFFSWYSSTSSINISALTQSIHAAAGGRNVKPIRQILKTATASSVAASFPAAAATTKVTQKKIRGKKSKSSFVSGQLQAQMEKLRYGWKCRTCNIRMRCYSTMIGHVNTEHGKKSA